MTLFILGFLSGFMAAVIGVYFVVTNDRDSHRPLKERDYEKDSMPQRHKRKAGDMICPNCKIEMEYRKDEWTCDSQGIEYQIEPFYKCPRCGGEKDDQPDT